MSTTPGEHALPPFEQYFPHAEGDSWTYRAVVGEDSRRHPMSCLGAQEFPDGLEKVAGFIWSDPFDPAPGNLQGFVLRPEGLFAARLVAHGGVRMRFDPPVHIIAAPFAPGTRMDRTGLFQADGAESNAGGEVRFSSSIEGPMTVDLPVGPLADCVAVTIHRDYADVTDSSRYWYAPGWGLVRAETLTSDGQLKTLELLFARVGGQTIGDPALAVDLAAFETATADEGEAAQGKPIGLAEIVRAIRPLNVDAQSVEGHRLSEICIRGRCDLLFRAEPDDGTGASADAVPAISAPGASVLPPPADDGYTARVSVFRNERSARRVPGDRARAGGYVLVIASDPPPASEALGAARQRLLAKVAALIRFNAKRDGIGADGEPAGGTAAAP